MAGKHLSLLVHFIWSTARREPWIGTDWQDDLYGYIRGYFITALRASFLTEYPAP